jgi:hypothetical protein
MCKKKELKYIRRFKMATVIMRDETENIINEIHKATGATGVELMSQYFVYASMLSELIGDKKRKEYFDNRLKEVNQGAK